MYIIKIQHITVCITTITFHSINYKINLKSTFIKKTTIASPSMNTKSSEILYKRIPHAQNYGLYVNEEIQSQDQLTMKNQYINVKFPTQKSFFSHDNKNSVYDTI